MLEGHDIVCFANDWDGDPLSKKHVMTRLARANRVLWVNSTGNRRPRASAGDLRRSAAKLRQFARGLRPAAEGIHVYPPLFLPLFGSAAARRLNRSLLLGGLARARRRLGFSAPITWSFLPTSADVAGALGERLVVYHCVDEFAEFTGTDRAAVAAMERRLLSRADVVIVSSTPLLEAKRRHHPDVRLVTHGVDVEHFRRACRPETPVPEPLAALPRPVVGFFGLIADWVDLELVGRIARARPGWSLVLVGKLDADPAPLAGLPNVHLPGRRPYAELPGWCRGFDVAVLPFAVNELTRAANPLKLREYLAAGLPVVATPLPEVERLGDLVRTGRDAAEFVARIEEILAAGRRGPDEAASRRMDGESWDEKVRLLGAIVEDAARRKEAAAR
jgi:glycosyltransferase involved in cell wall biosynthesis